MCSMQETNIDWPIDLLTAEDNHKMECGEVEEAYSYSYTVQFPSSSSHLSVHKSVHLFICLCVNILIEIA